MTCYAWRGREGEENLYEHLVETYKVASQMWELEALARKLSSLKSLGKEKVKEAVLAAALLHDVGKAASEYQNACARGECERFPGHYLVSTLYTYIVLKEGLGVYAPCNTKELIAVLSGGKEAEEGVVVSLLILLPIALHHIHQVYAYQSLQYSRDEENARRYHQVHSSCAQCLEDLASFISERFEHLGGLGKVRELPQLIAGTDSAARESFIRALNLVRNLENAVKGIEPSSLSLAIEAATGIVNLSDGYVAAKARSKRSQRDPHASRK